MNIVTFGEAMIRLTPPHFMRLEQTRSFNVEVGGAELNVATGLVRLGHHAEWVSALPRNPLGRLVRNHARHLGVGTSHIVWKDGTRVGLYFLEEGASPRASRILYDRAGSAISQISPHELDWPAIFKGAHLFHTSGITPALSESAAAATREGLKAAKSAGLHVTYDLNYRGKLWSPEKARHVQEPLMSYVDVLITSEACAEVVFGIRGETPAMTARRLAERFGFQVVTITLRETPSVLRNRVSALAYQDGQVVQDDWYEVEIVDRLGSGDAYTAGFICGYLEGNLERAVQLGNAMSALKHTIVGDLNWVDPEDVEELIRGGARFTIAR